MGSDEDIRCKEIAEELVRQLKAVGGDENMPPVERPGRFCFCPTESEVVA